MKMKLNMKMKLKIYITYDVFNIFYQRNKFFFDASILEGNYLKYEVLFLPNLFVQYVWH